MTEPPIHICQCCGQHIHDMQSYETWVKSEKQSSPDSDHIPDARKMVPSSIPGQIQTTSVCEHSDGESIQTEQRVSSETVASENQATPQVLESGESRTNGQPDDCDIDDEALQAAVCAAMDSGPVEELKDYWRIMRKAIPAYEGAKPERAFVDLEAGATAIHDTQNVDDWHGLTNSEECAKACAEAWGLKWKS